MAGLLFGVPKQEATQLLLREPIQRCFRKVDSRGLLGLHKTFGVGFELAFEKYKNDWMISESSNVEEQRRAANTLYPLVRGYKADLRKAYVLAFCEAMEFRFMDWVQSENIFLDTYTQYIELLPDKLPKVTWLDDQTTRLVAEILLSTKTSDKAYKQTNQLAKILEFLEAHNLGLQTYTPEKLPTENWRTWLALCEKSRLCASHRIYKLVTPKPEFFQELSKLVDSPLEESNLAIVLRTIELFPSVQDWVVLAEKITQWLSQYGGARNQPSLYKIVFSLLEHLNIADTKNLRTHVGRYDFWAHVERLDIDCLYYLALFYAMNLPSSALPRNEYVTNFWGKEQEPHTLEEAARIIDSLELSDPIWSLGKRGFTFALQLIEQSNSRTLFSVKAGAWNIEQIESRLEKQDMSSLVGKLIEGGAFAAISSDISRDPVEHSQLIAIFYNHGDAKTSKELESIVQKITEQQWNELIENNSALLCLAPSTLQFTRAYQTFLQALVSGPNQSPNQSALELLPDIKNKLLSFESTVSASVLEAYFDEDQDYLADEQFDILLPNGVSALGSVDESRYEIRI